MITDRLEGQVWIDRKAPYSIKYYVNGREYEVKNEPQYKYTSTEKLYAGTLVTLKKGSSDDTIVEKAIFPKDILKISGVVTENADGAETYLSMSHSGYVEISNPDKILKEGNNISNSGYDEKSIIGAPVYWYIGSTDGKGIVSYSEEDAGKLTLKTPSGYLNMPPTEDQLDVAYNNLPIIGFITKATIKDSTIEYMEIHLNFSTFDTTIEWSYPNKNKINTTDISTGKNITICHGLFPPNAPKKSIESCLEVSVSDENNDNLYKILAPTGNNFINNGGYSWAFLKGISKIDDLKITGTVSYNLKDFEGNVKE